MGSSSSEDSAKEVEPSHVALANAGPLDLNTAASPVPAMADAKAFLGFVKRYGPLRPRPEEQTPGHRGRQEASENLATFGESQLVLRRAWRGDNWAIDMIVAENQETARDRWRVLLVECKSESAEIERKPFEGSPIEWSPADPTLARIAVGKNPEIVVADLWSLTRLLFLQDHRMAQDPHV